MEPIRVRWIDRKGFSLTEFIVEPLQPVMTRRFALEPHGSEDDAERSVQIMFQRAHQEGSVVVYHEVLP